MSGKTYIYKPSGRPSFWNRDTAVGFSAGSLIFSPIVGLVGMLIGGFHGKSRIRNEQENGKAVSEHASFWNKNTLIGAAVGFYATIIPAVVISLTVAPALLPVMTGLSFVGLVVGTIIGGNQGITRQHNEYQTAKEWVRNNGGRNYEPGQEYERSNNIDLNTPQMQQTRETEKVAPQMMTTSQQGRDSDSLRASHNSQSPYQVPQKSWDEAKSKFAESGKKSFVDQHTTKQQAQAAQTTTQQVG